MRSRIEYGVFARWPQDGNAWIHPDDVRVARRILPGDRIFRRERTGDDYFLLHYGRIVLRIKPAMWQTVRTDGLEIGDRVEVLSRLSQNRPIIATIRDMRWDAAARCIRYYLRRSGKKIARSYEFADLRRLDPLAPSTKPSLVLTPSQGGSEFGLF